MNNNKQNGKQAKSESDDIITKKGFLISIPQTKKQSEGESSINFAKSNEPKPRQNAEKKASEKVVGEQKGKKKFDKKRDENRKNVSQSAAKSEPVQESDTDVRVGGGNRSGRQDKNRRDDNRHGKNGKHKVQAVQEDRREARANHEAAGGQRQPRADKNDRRDNRQSHGGNANRTSHGKNDRKRSGDREKEAKAAPLSALSSDIASYAKHKAESSEKLYTEPRVSLEEKYKNAKPLAEQIAEQELRQRGIKVPYGEEAEAAEENQEIVGVRFREAGKVYYFDPDGRHFEFGTPVIVETARGSEYGFIAISNRFIPVASLAAPLKKIERAATTADTQKHVYNKDMEKDAEAVFKEKVEKLGLPMNLIYVEYTFDNTRLLFYFTAETRIDFRELVKELASVFRTRIELRQIGVRDEAKTIGGLGICGRATCCNTFLGDFAQVSIKMAKDQNLSLNAAKISGACGKLMCCLRYEDRVYEEENARTPKVGSVVETVEGKGVVTEARSLKGIVIVSLENSPETPPKPFHRDEVTVVGFNKSVAKNGDEDESELKQLEDHQ